jgi:hypothetical protein
VPSSLPNGGVLALLLLVTAASFCCAEMSGTVAPTAGAAGAGAACLFDEDFPPKHMRVLLG